MPTPTKPWHRPHDSSLSNTTLTGGLAPDKSALTVCVTLGSTPALLPWPRWTDQLCRTPNLPDLRQPIKGPRGAYRCYKFDPRPGCGLPACCSSRQGLPESHRRSRHRRVGPHHGFESPHASPEAPILLAPGPSSRYRLQEREPGARQHSDP